MKYREIRDFLRSPHFRGNGADPRVLAWLLAALPLLAVHAAYLISASSSLVPWCLPYWDGCTSISRAARHGSANLVFKSLMLPHAAMLALFWLRAQRWLQGLRADAPRRVAAVCWLGVTAAAFLTLYVVFLGVDGNLYQWLRRYGITVYFSFTVLAQMLVLALLGQHPLLSRALRRAMLVLAASLLGLGLASIPLQHLARDADAVVNALEWSYALLMIVFYPLIGAAWQASGFGTMQH